MLELVDKGPVEIKPDPVNKGGTECNPSVADINCMDSLFRAFSDDYHRFRQQAPGPANAAWRGSAPEL